MTEKPTKDKEVWWFVLVTLVGVAVLVVGILLKDGFCVLMGTYHAALFGLLTFGCIRWRRL